MLSKFSIVMVALTLLFLPVMAGAQAPAQAPAATAAQPAAPPEAKPQAQPQPPCQPGPGGVCPMMTPEQMKQMQGKMGQCCMMQPSQGSPQCQQLQNMVLEHIPHDPRLVIIARPVAHIYRFGDGIGEMLLV